ncbi:MAG: hypothetical protein A3E78_17260 [Alphaproteobacteria bacterium RIFCSPHIGHO2_12_FULL_63_12]|nr:MAG: hypothetical protein A3E78_17260 [Alphaproteobacteria bacterium RIFCSPHIGHO2_12_FULL_63_12]
MAEHALLSNDAVIFGVLMLMLGFVFWSSESGGAFFRRFYQIFPPLLLCYFLPSLLTSSGLVDPDQSQLYFVASRFMLPAALVILTMVADLPATLRLGPKALTMFFTGTIGVVIGGPIALLVASAIAPQMVGVEGPDAVWRGMATVAGSWIGGAANQTAIREIFHTGPEAFSIWVAVDVIVANVWMAILLAIAANSAKVDKWLKADASAIDEVKRRAEALEAQNARIPSLKDLMFILAIGFGATGIAHFGADILAPFFKRALPGAAQFSVHSTFFWIVVIATIIGVVLSFTKVRDLQGAGASKVGSVFIYILVATVGLNMNIRALAETPAFFLIGGLWISIHAGLLILVAKLIRAPSFFLAVGSQANIGGAASAPVVAAAFHPSLAPVGVLLAVLGYIVGTFGGWISGQMMRAIVGQ